MKHRPRVWLVLSPEYTTYSGNEYEPPENGRDVMWVYCRGGKKRAMVLMLRAWRRTKYESASRYRNTRRPLHREYGGAPWEESGVSPFTGMRAERPKLGEAIDFACATCKAKGYIA